MKNVKNIIQETIQKKKKMVNEAVTIHNRLVLSMDGKKDLESRLVSVFLEMNHLNKRGYNDTIISESVNKMFDVLSKLYDMKSHEVSEKFKDVGIDFIMSKLQLDENLIMKDYLRRSLEKTDTKDIPKLFSDCEFLSNKIEQVIPDAYLASLDLDEGFGSEFLNIVQTELKKTIEHSDFKERLQGKLDGVICPLIDRIQVIFNRDIDKVKSNFRDKRTIE
jgi:hypothetical protein